MGAEANAAPAKRSPFDPGCRFHHVGVGVPSIERADPLVRPIVNRTEGVAMAFVEVDGVTLELLEPLGETSPIARSIAGGPVLLHLCFEVDNLDEALACGREAGFHPIAPPKTVPEWGGRRISWVFSRGFGLIELAERPM